MFTLCMSRGANKHLPDNTAATTNCGKQIKGGYLLRYKRGWLWRTWCEEWVVLYEDSTVAWFKDKGAATPGGRVRLSDAPELLAVGEWTRHVPRRPRIPADCHTGQLLALGHVYDAHTRTRSRVHWFMAQSAAEVSDWMTAISNTLPPPPRLTMDRDKRCSVTLIRDHNRYSNGYSNSSSLSRTASSPQGASAGVATSTGSAGSAGSTEATTEPQRRSFDGDHTVPPGVVIDWGHGWGWGWGEAAWAAQLACGHDVPSVGQALYCAAADDYSAGGYDDVVDYGACGDFSF